MTVQELIDGLQEIENKSLEVCVYTNDAYPIEDIEDLFSRVDLNAGELY